MLHWGCLVSAVKDKYLLSKQAATITRIQLSTRLITSFGEIRSGRCPTCAPMATTSGTIERARLRILESQFRQRRNRAAKSL